MQILYLPFGRTHLHMKFAPPEVTAKSMYLHRHHPVFRTFRFNHRLTAYSLRRTHGVLLFQKAWDSTTGDLRKCELITHSQNIKLQIHSSPSRQHCRRANEVSHTLIWDNNEKKKKKKKTDSNYPARPPQARIQDLTLRSERDNHTAQCFDWIQLVPVRLFPHVWTIWQMCEN